MTGPRALTLEDTVDSRRVTDAQISPGGDVVAFVMGDRFISDTKLPRSNLWVVPSTGGEPRQLTSGSRSDSTPRWSPDGRTLAFLSDRVEDGQRQIYLLPADGGEAMQLTRIEGDVPTPRGLNPMSWSPKGDMIAFLMTDPGTEEERRRKREKDDAIEFERHPKYTRLYLVDVKTEAVTCVSPDGMQVWEFCWAPSGKEMAVVASDLPFEHAWYSCRLAKFSVSGGGARTLYKGKRQVSSPTWSPDGGHIAFLSSIWSDRGVVAGGIFVVAADGGEVRELAAGHASSTSWLQWSDDSKRLVAVAQERGGSGLAELEVASGVRTTLWQGGASIAEPNWSQFSRDSQGRLAVVREDAETPRDVWLADRTSTGLEWRRLTRLHADADHLRLGLVETLHWKGADGRDMQGLLIRAAGGPSEARCPMVTVVHGGPTGAHGYEYYADHGWLQLLAAQGIAVFLPNPRGSTGCGLEFAESNVGDMGGKDWEDIQTGVDYCVEKGIADPDRLGIAGWSYGGFIAAWAVTQTNRFRAAVMGAGIADWRSFHGKSDLPDWDVAFHGGGDPYDPDGIYRQRSPITHVKSVSTPTLILHGEADHDVPVEQSHMFFRALKDLGVETELVVYPREPHGPRERRHILDIASRSTEWFVNHLEP